jgi:hypothetical protein
VLTDRIHYDFTAAVCSDFTYDKDRDDVYDDLLWLLATVVAVYREGLKDRSISDVMGLVEAGRLKAHAKHGDNSIEAKSGDDTLFWLACLGEEYGEACEAGNGEPAHYFEECIDLATITTAWIAALGRLD